MQTRTRANSWQLGMGALISLGLATSSGLLLWLDLPHGYAVQVLMLVHACSGLLCALLLPFFVVVHTWDVGETLKLWWQPWRWQAQRLCGGLLLWLLLCVLASGLIVSAPALGFVYGRPWLWPLGLFATLLDLHLAASVLALPVVLCHLGSRRARHTVAPLITAGEGK